MIKKIIQVIYCIYAMLAFAAVILILFFVVLFALPFKKIHAGDIIYKACNILAGVLYTLIGIKYQEIYDSPHDTLKQYIFVANHNSYMDIPAVVRCMHQRVRILGKQEMVKYPVFGVIYRAAVICVDRSSISNRAKSIRALKAAIEKGISVFIFPEGAFNETEQPLNEFYDGAFRIAVETQTPIKPILFLDNADRLHWRSIFTLTPGKTRVVYLGEVSMKDYTSLADVPALKQKVYEMMDECLRSYRNYAGASNNSLNCID